MPFAAIPLLCVLGLLIEIRVRGKDYKNKKVLEIILNTIIFMFIYLSWLLVILFMSGCQLGDELKYPFGSLITLPFGVLFIIMGNYMPVTKQSCTLGLKTTSTLKSETVCNKTHRLLGILAVIGGLVTILCSIISLVVKIQWISLIGIGVAVILSVIVPMIYARVIFKREQQENIIAQKNQ